MLSWCNTWWPKVRPRTIKPNPSDRAGKKKARLVACGNFAERSESELFAGGATAVALRARISIASQQGWSGRVCDIRTALLNAPMKLGASENLETEEHADLKITIIKPPPLLILAGLAKPDECWQVLMALYGTCTATRSHLGFGPTIEIKRFTR